MSNIISYKLFKGGGQSINNFRYLVNSRGFHNTQLASSIRSKAFQPKLRVKPLEARFYTSSTKEPSNPSSLTKLKLKEIIENLKKSPGSHLISFLTLHELTAILPVLIIFLILNQFDFELKLGFEYLEKGKKLASYFIKKLGLEGSDKVLKYTFNLTAAYSLVKLALPLRLAACLALTPIFANRVIQPIINRVKNFRKQ